VDTRVLQVIYWVENNNRPLIVGQQMDVFIDAGNLEAINYGRKPQSIRA
jgi:hypothetical protein